MRPSRFHLCIASLLAIFLAQTLWRAAHQSATWDEGGNLAAGYSYWAWGDYRVSTYNFILAQKIAALPLVWLAPRFPTPGAGPVDCTILGHAMLYELGNNPRELLLASRATIAVIGTILGLVVALWAKRLFGSGGALVALTCYVFEPNILAHSSLVTTDIVATLLLLGVTGAWWRLLHRCDFAQWLQFACLFTLMLVTKYSITAFAVIAVILVCIRLVARRPLTVALPFRSAALEIGARGAQLRWFIAAAALTVALAWFGIWAIYGFRFALPEGTVNWADAGPGTLTYRSAMLLRSWHVLPEAYIKDLSGLKSIVVPRPTFFAGRWYPGGVHGYFPLMFLLKTPIALLLAAAVSLGLLARVAWRCIRSPEDSVGRRGTLYECWPLVVLIVVYGGMACASPLNIGLRHLLPIYPALVILCGILVWLPWRQHWWIRALAVVSVGALGAAAAVSLSSPLAYFNEFAGGPSNGYRWAADSSYDWGGELPALGRWLAQHAAREMAEGRVHLAYFGTAQPSAWGVRARGLETFEPLAPFDRKAWQPGLYIFSATVLQTGPSMVFGQWTTDLEGVYRDRLAALDQNGGVPASRDDTLVLQKLATARLAAWLRDSARPPMARVGQVYFVFDLNAEDLRRALWDPWSAKLPSSPYSP
jgi:hypothetical protein